VTKLSKALGVTLPSDFGQITLVKSSDLAAVQQGVKAFDRLTLVLPLITILLIALSLWLSVNRRRTVLQLAVGVCLLMIVERRVAAASSGDHRGHAVTWMASPAGLQLAGAVVAGILLLIVPVW
jgi:hypothetical protein